MPPAAAAATTALPPSAQHQPWFQGAPMTKLLCLFWVICHVIYQNSNTNSYYWWMQSLVFGSTGELVVGVAFLAQLFRRLEREMGSRKLLVWLLWNSAISMAVQTLFVLTLSNEYDSSSLLATPFSDQNENENTNAQGPYGWMGAVLYWYYAHIPRLYPRFVSIGGISVSEKAVQYLWGMYLIGSQGWSSIYMAWVGILSSALFFVVLNKGNTLDLPDALANLVSWESIGNFFFLDPPPKVYAPLLLLLQQQQQQQRRATANGHNAAPRRPAAAAAPAAPPPPPPQAAIDQLTAMGFDEERVRQALQQTSNNVERAADRLLLS